ncbi:MAG TPA: alpha/beta hydrolase [Tepidisphaeraceae bacterium]|jgi:acetyl esterase/lipase
MIKLTTLATLALLSLSSRAADPPPNVDFRPDITYATVNGEELKLDFSQPKDATGQLPCVVVIHGGGWAAGNRKAHDNITWEFAKRGYVSATVSYRFAPKDPFPAQVQDVKAAVRFLRGNAERFHIDPAHVGAVGFSAGAHLSMMLGAMDKADGLDDVGEQRDQPSKVQAVVSYFGPTDLLAPYPDVTKPILAKFLGGSVTEKPDLARQASPITYVNAGDAPMLLFQGTKDVLVPFEQATLMADALTKANVPGRVELILGANHGWAGAEMSRTAEETYAFFNQYLKAKPPKKG